jgi:hypothetical protein
VLAKCTGSLNWDREVLHPAFGTVAHLERHPVAFAGRRERGRRRHEEEAEAPEPVVGRGLCEERRRDRLWLAEHREDEARLVLEHPPVGRAPLDPPRVTDLPVALIDAEPFGRLGERRSGLGGGTEHGGVLAGGVPFLADERTHQAEPGENDEDRDEVPHAPGRTFLRLPNPAPDSTGGACQLP